MTITQIAVTTTIVFMLLAAAAAIWSNRGYAFDLRRKADRRRDPNRAGGRREDDGRVAA